jgi:hypothetical protein
MENISKTLFQLHINYNILGLGVMFTQFDDGLVVAYVSRSNKKTKAKYNLYGVIPCCLF